VATNTGATGPTGATGATGAASTVTGPTGPTGAGSGSGGAFTFTATNSVSGNYTFVLTDAGKVVNHAGISASATIFTLPLNSSVAFPIDTLIYCTASSTGSAVIGSLAYSSSITILGGVLGLVVTSTLAGVVNSSGTGTIKSGFILWKIGTDTWVIV
jgi:hypothetical protein